MRQRLIVSVLLAVTAAVGSPSVAGASDPPVGQDQQPRQVGPSADELDRQEQMFSVFDPFYRKISKHPDGDGFAQAQVSEGVRSLILYWRGTIPKQVREFAANSVFPVELKPAKYSEADLGRLARSIKTRWNPHWGSYAGLSPEIGLSSFAVDWTPKAGVDPKGVARVLRQSVPGLGDSVRLHAAPALERTADDWRWNDSSPWNSGGGLALGDGGPDKTTCTLGPALRVNGAERFLTAGHCGAHDWVDGTGVAIGSTTFVSSLHDYQFVAANASGKVFVGAWNNYDGPTRNIEYLGGNAIGSWVCNEGANSGEHCSLQVYSSTVDTNGWTLWKASNPFSQSQVVNVGGDSGAPIISKGEVEATARGLNLGYTPSRGESCAGVPMRRSVSKCGSDVVYLSLSQIINHHPGATLIEY
ncbi:hypothetical protein GCM10009745_47730 [Kribbella yunnanensis]|uniref:Peptidase S1 domain-containing protein n=1 Tax=Kribbella yunnanensis TaxID=190194 RepID=A0ABN2HZP4_9ACTN